MAEKKNILTYAGLRKLEDELQDLKVNKRNEVAQKIREAREQGDLSENAEYTAAKNAQEKLEIDIARLTEMLSKAYPIDTSLLKGDVVEVGTYVKVYDVEFEEELDYQVVSSCEADTSKNRISNESPIGRALMGKKVGAKVTFDAPGGEMEFKILKVYVK